MKALPYVATCIFGLLLSAAATAQYLNPGGVSLRLHSQGGAVIPYGDIPVVAVNSFLQDSLIPTESSTELLQPVQISPSRPIPTGQAPGMQVKLVSKHGSEKVYAVIFRKGDEVLSGLTDFAIQNHIVSAHFTAIGAVSSATVGWLNLPQKMYNPIQVGEQVEVLSMMGDIALFNGKPTVHAHMVFGKSDGSTVGGHLWEAHVNPTLEVFVTAHPTPLRKKVDDASGMKLIDPTQ